MATNNSFNSSADMDVDKGGTGRGSHTAYSVICGGTTTTGPQQSVVSVGTSGQTLQSQGAGALPIFATAAGGSSVWTHIETQTVTTDVATIDFETGISSTYEHYFFLISGITPATASSTTLRMRVGTGGTPTYQSGLTDYGWSNLAGQDQSDSEMDISGVLGATANGDGTSMELMMSNPADTGVNTNFVFNGGRVDSSSVITRNFGCATYLSTTAVTAIRFYMSTGDVDYGVISLYGVSKS